MKQRSCHCCGGTGKEIDQTAIAAELREKREKSGLSLREVARRMGFTAPYLSDLELGRRNWSEEKVAEYLEALKK